MTPEKDTRGIAERFADNDLVTRALGKGVRDALILHKKMGNPIAVSRNGKTVLIPPEEIQIPDEE